MAILHGVWQNWPQESVPGYDIKQLKLSLKLNLL